MNSSIRPFKKHSLNNMNNFYFKMNLNSIRHNFSVERDFFFFVRITFLSEKYICIPIEFQWTLNPLVKVFQLCSWAICFTLLMKVMGSNVSGGKRPGPVTTLSSFLAFPSSSCSFNRGHRWQRGKRGRRHIHFGHFIQVLGRCGSWERGRLS